MLIDLRELGFKIGRDQLFNLLRNNDLLLKQKRNHTRTTYSAHRFRIYKNLIKDIAITRANQVFVSDITYVRTLSGFCYLALVTDAFSRKIVGYDLSRSLAIEGAARALKMALKDVAEPKELIHHSDRGIQYCSNSYVKILTDKRCKISMTEESHVYENALAERVNGILKSEFELKRNLQSFKVAKELVTQAVNLYNRRRRHTNLNYQIPEHVHQLSIKEQNNKNLKKENQTNHS